MWSPSVSAALDKVFDYSFAMHSPRIQDLGSSQLSGGPVNASKEQQLSFLQCLVRVAATAIATEGVVGSVRGDHKSATNQSDENLNPV
jgi:hypothetical protein